MPKTGETSKKTKNWVKKVEKQITDFVYNVTDKAAYQDILRRVRVHYGEQRPRRNDVYVLPPPGRENQRSQYIKLKLVLNENGESYECSVIFRATDLYAIGYETQNGELVELKPDDGKEREIDADFSSSPDKKNVKEVKILSFGGSYSRLVARSKLRRKQMIPLGSSALKKAVRTLASSAESETAIALGLLTVVAMISEAIRMRIIERHIVRNFESTHVLNNMLCDWTNKWDKVSQVIASGAVGANATLAGFNLQLENDANLLTVEQAKEVVAIMPPPTAE